MKIEAGIWTWIAAAGLSLFSVTCSAQSICPWLNAATASGVLGGTATVEVSNTGGNTRVCRFRLQNEAKNDALRISVIEGDNPESAVKEMTPDNISCTSSETQLKAVGNEAVLCAGDTGISRGEQVVGRVRNRIFTVAISTGKDSEATRDLLGEKVEEIARQVAGALF
jgi:hypothetical protein